MRQAQHRTVCGERRQRVASSVDGYAVERRSKQPQELALAFHDHALAPLREHSGITHELDRIAEALLAVKEEHLAGLKRAAVPQRRGERAHRRTDWQSPAPLVFAPTGFKVSVLE